MTLKELKEFFKDQSALKFSDRKKGYSFVLQLMPARKKLIPEEDALKYLNDLMYKVSKDKVTVFPVVASLKRGKVSIKRLDKKTAFTPKANAYILTKKTYVRKVYKFLSEIDSIQSDMFS